MPTDAEREAGREELSSAPVPVLVEAGREVRLEIHGCFSFGTLHPARLAGSREEQPQGRQRRGER